MAAKKRKPPASSVRTFKNGGFELKGPIANAFVQGLMRHHGMAPNAEPEAAAKLDDPENADKPSE